MIQLWSQVVKCVNCEKWLHAMKKELKFMERNDVWHLVELLKCWKRVDSKWVFKTKCDSRDNF